MCHFRRVDAQCCLWLPGPPSDEALRRVGDRVARGSTEHRRGESGTSRTVLCSALSEAKLGHLTTRCKRPADPAGPRPPWWGAARRQIECRFHDLRHTHATQLLKAGVHPKVVSERLGHASIGITLNTYSHVMPGMQKEAAEKIDARLRAALAG